MKHPQAPAWGKENAYELLVRYYLREKQAARARAYYDKAKQLYPNSYAIRSLAKPVGAS